MITNMLHSRELPAVKIIWGNHARRMQNRNAKNKVRSKIARASRQLNRRMGYGR